jgi:hypothetical protein
MGVVLDYTSQPASFSEMKAHGVEGAVVYVAPLSWGYTKTINLAGVQAAAAAKFLLTWNFEQNIDDYLGGYTRGVAHGAAIEQALNELQIPWNQSGYLSIDTSVPPDKFPLADDYWRGAQTATRRPIEGCYGTSALAMYLASKGRIKRHWRSGSHGYYGNGSDCSITVLDQQVGGHVGGLGGSYDVNTIVKPDWGQFPRPTTEPTVTSRYPTPINVIGGIAASLPLHGGEVLAGLFGHIYALDGAPYEGAPAGKPYWANRNVHDLVLPDAAEAARGNIYTVIGFVPGASQLSRYAFPKG